MSDRAGLYSSYPRQPPCPSPRLSCSAATHGSCSPNPVARHRQTATRQADRPPARGPRRPGHHGSGVPRPEHRTACSSRPPAPCRTPAAARTSVGLPETGLAGVRVTAYRADGVGGRYWPPPPPNGQYSAERWTRRHRTGWSSPTCRPAPPTARQAAPGAAGTDRRYRRPVPASTGPAPPTCRWSRATDVGDNPLLHHQPVRVRRQRRPGVQPFNRTGRSIVAFPYSAGATVGSTRRGTTAGGGHPAGAASPTARWAPPGGWGGPATGGSGSRPRTPSGTPGTARPGPGPSTPSPCPGRPPAG